MSMTEAQEQSEASDPHDLARFVEAQEDVYAEALSEIRSGRKRSHWMWLQLDFKALRDQKPRGGEGVPESSGSRPSAFGMCRSGDGCHWAHRIRVVWHT
jgi:hypothetical protein